MHPLFFTGKWLLLAITYSIIWSCSTLFFDLLWDGGITDSGHESSLLVFFIVTAFNMLVIAWYLVKTVKVPLSSRILTSTILLFGLQFLLPQTESWWYRTSLDISLNSILVILASGLVASLLVCTFAALLFTTSSKRADAEYSVDLKNRSSLYIYLFLAVVFYPFAYFVFGYYISWQFEEIRLFYTESQERFSFLYRLSEGYASGLFAYQVARGLIWIVLGIILINTTGTGKTATILLTATTFTVLFCSQLLISNPIMPRNLQFLHLIETGASTLIWGAIIAFIPGLIPKKSGNYATARSLI